MAGSATPTTVLSRNTAPEPNTDAAINQRPRAEPRRRTAESGLTFTVSVAKEAHKGNARRHGPANRLVLVESPFGSAYLRAVPPPPFAGPTPVPFHKDGASIMKRRDFVLSSALGSFSLFGASRLASPLAKL